jgi:hypothetical protein
LALVACHYDPLIPEGIAVCNLPKDCPGGYRCQPKPGTEISVCCRTAGCGFLLEADAAMPAEKLDAPPSKPDLAADKGSVGGQTGNPDLAADLAPADAADAATPDAPGDVPAPVPPDAGPDLTPDLAPEAGLPCPASRGGPALVRAGSFCIDSTEVTNRQYLEFLSSKGSDMSGQPTACKWNTSYIPSSEDVAWPFPMGHDNYPVSNVDWCDAYMFCSWSGKRLCGKIGGGRLASVAAATAPASAQWMHACSAGGLRSYPYSGAFSRTACNTDAPTTAAMYVEEVKKRATCEGGYSGLFDMGGNLEEWIDACDKDATRDDSCGIAGSTSFMGTLTANDLTCSGSIFGEKRDTQYYLLGIRCCAD